MCPQRLSFLTKGSEFVVYDECRLHVVKKPRRLSWRRLIPGWLRSAKADIATLTKKGIAHGNACVLTDKTFIIDGREVRLPFVIRQDKIAPVRIIHESDLDQRTIRLAVLHLLAQSLGMACEGRAIDMTGMEAITHFVRSLLNGQQLDLGMHNLHWDGRCIVLMDTGLLPTAGWHPVVIVARRIAHLQHELVMHVLEGQLHSEERDSKGAYAYVQRKLEQTRRGLLGQMTAWLAAQLYQVSRRLVPAT